MRRAIGVVLMVDGLLSAWWFTSLLASLGGRDTLSVAAIVCRTVLGILAVIAGWLVTQRRPPGDGLAALVAATTAGLTTAGHIWRLLPTNLDPGLRVPVVIGYWVFAAAVVVFAAWSRNKMPSERTSERGRTGT